MNRMNKEGIRFGIISSGEKWKAETGMDIPSGSILIRDGGKFLGNMPGILDGISSKLIGLQKSYSDSKSVMYSSHAPRIGLYKPWTANLNEGWTRFVLDAFEFDYASVVNAEILAGNLRDRYDCLILPSMSTGEMLEGNLPGTTDPEYTGGIGPDGVVSLQRFVENGGTLVCIDESCNLPIEYFNIPVKNMLEGKSQKEFFCRGSSLRISVDQDNPLGYGMSKWSSAYFYDAQIFDVVKPGETNKQNAQNGKGSFPVSVVARYADTALVETGIIRAGEDLIKGKPAIVEVKYGKGHIILLGFRVNRNGQTYGTFRFLFNAIQRSIYNTGNL
jgi:hypothetical protein